MTDLTPIKTVLVNALTNHAVTYNGGAVERASLIDDGVNISFDSEDERAVDALLMNQAVVPLDRLATAIHDHYATVLSNIHGEAIRHAFIAALLTDKLVTVDERGRIFQSDRELKTDQMIHVFADRLIASLAGGSQ